MKTHLDFGFAPLLTLTALSLAVAAGSAAAQGTNYLADQFDTDTSGVYGRAWGDTVPVLSWDSSVNRPTDMGPNTEGSGSLRWDVDWSAGGEYMITRRFDDAAILDLRAYTNVSFDLRFDPASAKTADGASYGFLEIDWVPQSDGWPSTPNNPAGLTVPITNEWIHVSLPIDQTMTKLAAVTSIGFKMNANKTGSLLSGTQTFWIDNIIFGVRATTEPGPTLSIAPVKTPAGLTIVASGGGNEYNRGMIRTIDPLNGVPLYSWIGYGDVPVTYSLTITNYPDSAHNAFQSQIFLIPGESTDPGVDWSAPDVIFLDIQNQPDGTAFGTFRYKTNQPQGNAMFYGSGALARIQAASPLGKWSLTFSNDTNVTMTGPGGVSTNFNIPDTGAIQSLFGNPLSAYFGNQQNGAGNAGQSSTYSRVTISGVSGSPEIDDTFPPTGLDTNLWKVVCREPSDVFVMGPEDKFWLSWTLPDTGFTVQSSPNLAAGSWVDPSLTNVVYTTLGNRVLVPQAALPSAGRGFFRLVK